jgi:hypothetical protein
MADDIQTIQIHMLCILRISKGRQVITYPYHIEWQVLRTVNHNSYLGVALTNTLSWDVHINKIIGKANRSLGFLRINIGSCPTKIKRQAYLGLTTPIVWDPCHQKHICQLEMVQRRSARFNGYMYNRQPGTVRTLLEELDLPILQERRNTSRLLLFHKVIHQKESYSNTRLVGGSWFFSKEWRVGWSFWSWERCFTGGSRIFIPPQRS